MRSEKKSIRSKLLIGLCAWIVSSAAVLAQSATRHLPDFISPGVFVPVSITIDTSPDTVAVGVQDSPPVGWMVSNPNEGGFYDVETHNVKWGPFFAPSIPSVLTYDAAPPSQVVCVNCFAGTVSFNGFNQPVGGEQCITTDCNANGVPDVCDIRDGTSTDLNANGVPDECECSIDPDCNDGNVCTYDRCLNGVVCSYFPNMFGDVDHNDEINIFDLFCILQGFRADFAVCSFQDDDIEPCAGNGIVDVFDLFAVLNAFSGVDPCCSP